jgi:aminomethyltransferase
MPLRTPFYDFHASAGAKLVDYAGWEMPLLYRGIVPEHQHTRQFASLFDISHMGRLRFSGPDALAFLDKVLTRKIADQSVGTSRYSLVCNETGGVLDDVIVSRDEKDWLVVCNASNRAKLMAHFQQVVKDNNFNVTIDDQTERTAMVAIQGPAAMERLANILPFDVKGMKRYSFENCDVMFIRLVIFRSGYTGEDGVEIILPARAASMAMKMMGGKLSKTEATLQPAGLGARDTLRMEAAMPLYGHELSEQMDPISAGLSWAVDLTKEFIGAKALREVAGSGPKQKLVGLEIEGRRIARQDAVVRHNGQSVGRVTSGTLSPTLERVIALAYVDAALADPGTALDVDLGGATVPAKIVKLPFYKRPGA